MVGHLKSLAGPQNSLAQVGSSAGTAAAGITMRDDVFAVVDPGSANDYRCTLDISTGDFVAGDLLVALAHADAGFSATTVISTAGWTLIKTADGGGQGARLYMKISDGTETAVQGESCRNGGTLFFAIAGAGMPDATDISNADAVETGGSGGNTTISALSDRTGDANLIMCITPSNTLVQVGLDAAPLRSDGFYIGNTTGSQSNYNIHLAGYAGSGALVVFDDDNVLFVRVTLREA